ncbi:MAG: NTPase [Anaerolineae bacterium]
MHPTQFQYVRAALLDQIAGHDMHTTLILVTGLSGSGKTTWCARLAEEATARGLRVAGLLCPAVFTAEGKAAIDVVDLITGERRRLADLRGVETHLPTVGEWQFYPEVIAWANHALRDLPNPDLLIIDELGPLEFKHHDGFLTALSLLDARHHRAACVVVRHSLLSQARARWPWHGSVIDLTPDAKQA